MDYLALLGMIPTLLRIFEGVKTAFNQGFSLNALESLIDSPDIRGVLRQIGAKLLPKVADDKLASAALALSMPDHVIKVQNGMNTLTGAGLDVDGHYGPKTRAAVLAFQAANGLLEDEYAGDKTMAKIAELLAARSTPQKVAITIPSLEVPAFAFA